VRRSAGEHGTSISFEAWDTGSLAFMGALAGMMLVIGHEVYDISLGHFHAVDPFPTS
jgi:hypothetical protein